MPEAFRTRVVRGTGWVALSTWTVRLAGLATFVVLGRLLTPSELGTAVLALGVAGFAGAVLDLGFSTYLVRAEELDETDVATAFWLVLLQAVVAGLLLIGLAAPLADLLDSPVLEPAVQVLTVTLLLNALAVVPSALLLRDLDMRALAIREVLSGVVSAVAGVGAAVAGLGVWSLVVQAVVQAAVATVLIWRLHPWRPRRRFSGSSALTMARFGLPLLGTTIVQQLRDRVDQFILGAVAGTTVLGYWAVATRILSVITQVTIAVLDQVALPAFARRRNDHVQLVRAFEIASAYATAALGPAVAVVSALSPLLIPFLFGPSWGAAIVPAQILCLAYGIGALTYFARPLYLAEGRTGVDLLLTLVSLGIHVALVAAVGRFGLTVLSIALVGETLAVFALNVVAMRRVAGMSMTTFVRPVLALLASAVTYVVTATVLGVPGPAPVVVVLAGMAGAATYAALLWLLLRGLVREVLRDVLDALPDRSRTATTAVVGRDDSTEHS